VLSRLPLTIRCTFTSCCNATNAGGNPTTGEVIQTDR
jgi:hypothetical protein